MTNNQLTEAELTETLDAATSGYPLTASAEENLRSVFAELQERRKADSEPVFCLEVARADYKEQKLGNHFGFITLDTARKLEEGKYQLYLQAQQSLVVQLPQVEQIEQFGEGWSSYYQNYYLAEDVRNALSTAGVKWKNFIPGGKE